MRFANLLNLFTEIDAIKAQVQSLDRYDPVLSVIKDNFKLDITKHLTSLSSGDAFDVAQPKAVVPENFRLFYQRIGVQHSITQLLFDITQSKLDAQHIVLLYDMLFSTEESVSKFGESEKMDQKIIELISWYKSNQGDPQIHPIMLACGFHHKFSVAQPFPDGNGRIGRLLMNVVLLQHDYLPILILPNERAEYYRVLSAADNGDLRPLTFFMARKELDTLNDFVANPGYLSVKAKYDLEMQSKQLHGGEKCIVLTEDSNTNGLLALVLQSSGFDMKETNIISYEGCSKIASANLFSMFVKEKMPWVKIVVHRDRDYLTDAEIDEIAAPFGRIDVFFFVTRGTDVESYFLNAAHVLHCHPKLNSHDADSLVKQCVADSQSRSVDLLRKKELGGSNSMHRTHLNRAIEELVRKQSMRFTHGKTALKYLEQRIQNQYRQKAKLEKPSAFIADETLKRIAKRIWGE
jgi:hypothetical protein